MKPVIHLSPISHSGGSAPAKKTFNLEIRLKHLRLIKNFFRPGQINQVCSVRISTSLWGITNTFPGRDSVPLFEALEAYVGPIAGDKQFSRRMDAVTHTLRLMESLQRIALCKDLGTARQLYSARGIGGLAESAPQLTELNRSYLSLTDKDQKVLWVCALLHDIGKATGNRERHPAVGLAKLEKSPEILQAVRKALSPAHTDAEMEIAEAFIRSIVGEHDLIGGLAITRDRNIFECSSAIIKASPEHEIRLKLLSFLTLVNFADIDSQGEHGIFTNQKITAFMGLYRKIKQILANPNEAKDFAWWGQQRLLAWAKGDTPGIAESRIEELIMELVPNRPEFIEFVGRLRLFDGMYNLSTAIHNPEIVLKFIVWAIKTAKKEGCSAITFDINFLTDPRYMKALKSGQEFDNTFTLATAESNGSRVLRLSIDF